MQQKMSLILPYEFEIVFQSLPLAEAGRLVLAIYAYEQRNEVPNFSDNPMLQFAWGTHIKPKIDENIDKYNAICEARRSAGSKGGKATQEKQKQSNQANASFDKQNNQKVANQADYDCDYDCDNDCDSKEKIIKKEKPPKHKYGQYQNVMLSDDELAKLKMEFPADWEERIERVSEYCASKGVTYKNYLATIRTWARKDNRPRVVAKNDVQSGLAQALELLGEQNG